MVALGGAVVLEVLVGMVAVIGLMIVYQLGMIRGRLHKLDMDRLNRTDFIMMTAQVRDAIGKLGRR